MPQICFRDHVGLPGQPNPPDIDGFVEPEDFVENGFGSTPSQVDPGWTGAARITYVADGALAAGRPLADFQCLKQAGGDFIYLSFVVRRDTQFHDQDAIVLVLRPSFPASGEGKNGSERRIDIFPNSEGVGAGSGPAAEPRHNMPPRAVEYYRWKTTPAPGFWENVAAPTNVTIRCRSWNLGTNNRNWSVEVCLPTVSGGAGGGDDWINLGDRFGVYANVIRLCSGPGCSFNPTPFDGGSFQFVWPRANYATGQGLIQGVAALSLAEIPLSWLSEAFLGSAAAGCSGVAGVKFQNGGSSIGVLAGGAITSGIHRTNANTFIARVVNTATTAADGVAASFRIANWGIGPGYNNRWNIIPATGGTSNPTAGATIPSGGAPVDLTMQWQLNSAEQGLYGTPPAKPLSSHQCIWVSLDSVQAVDFVESSVRRNCDFVPLSEHEQVAEISGDGYPPPPDGAADQDMALIVSQARRGRLVADDDVLDFARRNLERLTTGRTYQRGKSLKGRGNWLEYLVALLGRLKIIYEWFWVMDAYRKTEFSVGVDGKTYRIYEPVGSFGYIADHEGLVSAWDQSVTPVPGDAGRFQQTGPDAYRLLVPNGGKAHLVTRLKATEFKFPWWLLLLLLIIIIVVLYLLFN